MTVRVSTWEGNAHKDPRPFRVTVRYTDRADHHRFRTEAERADFLARIAAQTTTTPERKS